MKTSAARRRVASSFFHAYDVRGRFPEEIDLADARDLGRAIGLTFRGPFVVGRDTRRESLLFWRGLAQGLRTAGVTFRSIGIAPTAAVAFCARRYVLYGLAVTPSHNPLGFAGLKGFLRSGVAFGHEWRQIRTRYLHVRSGGQAGIRRKPGPPTASGRRFPHTVGWRAEYLDHVAGGLYAPLRVVLDCRGGATAELAPEACRRLGAKVANLHPGFSARFHGASPEPTAENVTPLAREVVRRRAEMGIAFDGDGDRAVFVDAQGRVAEPEVIAWILYGEFSTPPTPIVASVDASRRCETLLAVARCRVGSRFVAATMRRVKSDVGFEPSGHYYLREHGSDSDGLLVACRVAHALAGRGSSLDKAAEEFGPIFRQVRRFDFRSHALADRVFQRLRRVSPVRSKPQIEGISLELPEGWCLVRRSNTQPSIRLTMEARSRETTAGLRSECAAVFGPILGEF